MPVESVVADVGLTVGEPSVEVLVGSVENGLVGLHPVEALGLTVEESRLVFDAVFVGLAMLCINEVLRTQVAVCDVLREVDRALAARLLCLLVVQGLHQDTRVFPISN